MTSGIEGMANTRLLWEEIQRNRAAENAAALLETQDPQIELDLVSASAN